MKNKITSAGIIRNADKPRVGVVALNSLQDWVTDEIDQGIDLGFEEFCLELKERGIEEDSSEWYKEVDHYEMDSRTILFGDAWKKNKDGKYYISKRGANFAAVYNSDSGIVTVEWSKTKKRCHHTSPCYVMSDGSGPCGDLDTPGDSVVAYSLPEDYFRKEGEE